MGSKQYTPDEFAKKLFWMTIVGCALFIGTSFAIILTLSSASACSLFRLSFLPVSSCVLSAAGSSFYVLAPVLPVWVWLRFSFLLLPSSSSLSWG